MKPPKPGTIRARVIELLANQPGLVTREIAQAIRPDVPDDTAVGIMLRKWRGVDFRSEPVAGQGPGKAPTHRWYLVESGQAEPTVEVDELDDADAILRALRLEVDLTRDEAIAAAKGLRSTLEAVCVALGCTTRDVVDAIEELQRQVEDAKSKPAPTPGAPENTAPDRLSDWPATGPRSGLLAEVEARADTWRAAHEQLARVFVEASRK